MQAVKTTQQSNKDRHHDSDWKDSSRGSRKDIKSGYILKAQSTRFFLTHKMSNVRERELARTASNFLLCINERTKSPSPEMEKTMGKLCGSKREV